MQLIPTYQIDPDKQVTIWSMGRKFIPYGNWGYTINIKGKDELRESSLTIENMQEEINIKYFIKVEKCN